MRRAKVDSNQKQIVDELRQYGCTVQHLHAVHGGCPDILVGAGGRNYTFEIKQENGKLTPPQIEWHDTWRGQVCIITSTNEALQAMGIWGLEPSVGQSAAITAFYFTVSFARSWAIREGFRKWAS